ncbi:hypothetical protein NMG60_11034234 [Bertholletia excelsa]
MPSSRDRGLRIRVSWLLHLAVSSGFQFRLLPGDFNFVFPLLLVSEFLDPAIGEYTCRYIFTYFLGKASLSGRQDQSVLDRLVPLKQKGLCCSFYVTPVHSFLLSLGNTGAAIFSSSQK